MKFDQLMLSNLVSDYQNPTYGLLAMLSFDIVEVQAELFRTRTNVHGEPFTPDGTSPWEYLENNGVTPYAYFNAVWPDPPYTLLSPIQEDDLSDPYHLRKRHTFALRDTPAWRLDSYDEKQPERYTANAASSSYRDFIVSLLVDTGIPRFRFDDGTLHRMSLDVMEGWFEVYRRLREFGVEVYVNGAWQMADPYATPRVYPAMDAECLDGVTLEDWVGGHYDGVSTPTGWWELGPEEYKSVVGDWRAAGYKVFSVTRWRASEKATVAKWPTYDNFTGHFIHKAKSSGAVAAIAYENYRRTGWLDKFADYQGEEESFEEAVITFANDNQLISLNVYAALQKVMLADGFTPVGNEERLVWDDEPFIVQKGDPLAPNPDGTQPLPRAYYCPLDMWEEVAFYEIPREDT